MKKLFVFIIFICTFAFSCTNKEKEMVVDVVDSKPTLIEEKPYSNPAIIYGSDFVSFMQSLRKIGDYETMVCFTSSESLQKYGEKRVIQYYNEKFNNMSELKLQSIVENENGKQTMNFVNLSMATKKTASVDIVIENDSCKLVLPVDLNKKLIN
jgi:hypothetical protein